VSAPSGITTAKYLSVNPSQYTDAAVHAIRTHLGIASNDPIPSDQIGGIYIGTTLATNALLERKGARVGLLITRGFRDLLEIGYQNRPDLFALEIVKPTSLAAAVAEVEERILASGEVRTQLDSEGVQETLHGFRDSGIDSLAVV
jgi:5-oxoprolinase (ATP-hydrolysing)